TTACSGQNPEKFVCSNTAACIHSNPNPDKGFRGNGAACAFANTALRNFATHSEGYIKGLTLNKGAPAIPPLAYTSVSDGTTGAPRGLHVLGSFVIRTGTADRFTVHPTVRCAWRVVAPITLYNDLLATT